MTTKRSSSINTPKVTKNDNRSQKLKLNPHSSSMPAPYKSVACHDTVEPYTPHIIRAVSDHRNPSPYISIFLNQDIIYQARLRIIKYCPRLLHTCSCKICQHKHTPSSRTKSEDIRIMQSIGGNCVEEENVSIVKIVSIGISNDIPHLLLLLNDINTQLIIDKYLLNFEQIYRQKNSKNTMDVQFSKYSMIGGTLFDENTVDNRISVDFKESEFQEDIDSDISRNSSSNSNMSMIDSRLYQNYAPFKNIPVHQALCTFHYRFLPPINFFPEYLIADPINDYMCDIILMSHAIRHIAKQMGMPFQIDLWIIPSKVISSATNEVIENMDGIGDICCRLNSLPNAKHKQFHYSEDTTLPKDFSSRAKSFVQQLSYITKESPQCGRYIFIIDKNGNHSTNKNPNHYHPLLQIPVHFKQDSIHIQNIERFRLSFVKQKRNLVKCNSYKLWHTTHIQRLNLMLTITKEDFNDISATNEECEENLFQCSITSNDVLYVFQPPGTAGNVINGSIMNEEMHMNTINYLLPGMNKNIIEFCKSSSTARSTSLMVDENTLESERNDDCKNFKSGSTARSSSLMVHENTLESERNDDCKNIPSTGNSKFFEADPPSIVNAIDMNTNQSSERIVDENLLCCGKSPLGAKELCFGKMFVISYHVLSIEEMKCYLYLDKKMMKFEFEDMRRILPFYFTDTACINVNNSDSNNNNSDENCSKISPAFRLRDDVFETWMNRIMDELSVNS